MTSLFYTVIITAVVAASVAVCLVVLLSLIVPTNRKPRHDVKPRSLTARWCNTTMREIESALEKMPETQREVVENILRRLPDVAARTDPFVIHLADRFRMTWTYGTGIADVHVLRTGVVKWSFTRSNSKSTRQGEIPSNHQQYLEMIDYISDVY